MNFKLTIIIGVSVLLFTCGCFQIILDWNPHSRTTPIKYGAGHQMTKAEVEELRSIYGRRMTIGAILAADMTTNAEAKQAYSDLRVKVNYYTQDFEMGLSQSGKVIYWVEKRIDCIRPSFARRILPIMVVLFAPTYVIIAIMELKKARCLRGQQ